MSRPAPAPFDRIGREDRRLMVAQVQEWFERERGEELGDLAAEFILEFVVNLAGPVLYNAALADAAKVFAQYAELVESDVAALQQEPAHRR